jgi:hypothetical protein
MHDPPKSDFTSVSQAQAVVHKHEFVSVLHPQAVISQAQAEVHKHEFIRVMHFQSVGVGAPIEDQDKVLDLEFLKLVRENGLDVYRGVLDVLDQSANGYKEILTMY